MESTRENLPEKTQEMQTMEKRLRDYAMFVLIPLRPKNFCLPLESDY